MMTACSETSDYSPEQMINNALDEKESESYVAEATSTIRENEDVVEAMKMKEWHSKDGKIRVEIENQNEEEKAISVNDGEKITTYEVEQNQAIVVDDEEILEFNQPSPKEQVDLILDMVRDTHQIEGKGEEEIAGRSAYHLVATPKKDDVLLGKQEIWIDKENWIVLKIVSSTGNQKTEIVYNNIDFDTSIPDEKFTLDLPDDVDIVNSDDLLKTEEVTLEEAKEGIGKPFLYFPEEDGVAISAIEMDELKGKLNRTEINIDYKKEDAPFLTLSVFESPEDTDEDLLLPDEEKVTIRNQDGTYTDSNDFRALFWQEDGLNYSLVIIDPSLTLEELQALTETMDTVK
ncbi:LolA family protein [Virgibacillus alimentarius]|uniref:Outer membrane lipoprotein-sorting protein n=2 Tax=Virgibacillus alimentarius TaxID=698769 RepID=A0ABS4SAA7_9BACI|nr:sigma-E factor regulatory protein RseB domain-containing protein [Virgibacillus alimentarius]MBP2258447.1 outer membrane lipoprotein-sorting protein [Virgibacillus alimentarius]